MLGLFLMGLSASTVVLGGLAIVVGEAGSVLIDGGEEGGDEEVLVVVREAGCVLDG
jgi:hypothetical protein